MKKSLIAFCLSMLMLLCFGRNVDAVGSLELIINNDVSGYIGETITNQTVEITLSDSSQYFFNVNSINIDDDITSWFTNIPSGCNYNATVSSVSQNQIDVVFSGSIDNDVLEDQIPITMTVPYIPDDINTIEINEEKYYILQNTNPYISSLSDIDNTNANYIIEKHPFEIAYKGPYTIAGIVGQKIEPQTVEVQILSGGPSADEFDLSIDNFVFPTINGLTPTVTYLNPNNLEITITYTGTPIDPSQELIHTTIPKENMHANIEDRVVPDREDVKFNTIPININKDSETNIFIIPNTGIN